MTTALDFPDLPLAVITDLVPAPRGGSYILVGRCEHNAVVRHGAGFDLDEVADYLGGRSAHPACCKPGNYELVDPAGVLARRVEELRDHATEADRMIARRADRLAARWEA